MPKVLMIIGDAAEVLDTMYAYYRIPEDGFELVVAAPEKRLYHLVMHEKPPGWDITRESAGYHLASNIAFRDVKPEEYVGLFISGGRAPDAALLREAEARRNALPRHRDHCRRRLHPRQDGNNDRQVRSRCDHDGCKIHRQRLRHRRTSGDVARLAR
jgi:hypothetical protein